MLWWMTSMALGAGLPGVQLEWKGDDAALTVLAGAGDHVSEEAPAQVAMRWGSWTLDTQLSGAEIAHGVPLWKVQGQSVEGALNVSICDDAGTTCRLVEVEVSGEVPAAKKGSLALQVQLPTKKVEASPYRQDAQAIADAAYAQAKRENKRVLLDFGAVWCPPCNLLAAEVLEAEEKPDLLVENYVVAMMDVDDPSSWTMKNTYAVGGYPTLVITDADGRELTRKVGYEDRDDFVDWLAEGLSKEAPDPDWATVDPATVPPEKAGEVAWQLANARADYEPWLKRAAEAPDNVDYRLAAYEMAPSLEHATWLADNAPGHAIEWVLSHPEIGEKPEGASVIRKAIDRDLRDATGPVVSDLLYAAAKVAPEAERPTLYAAALASVRGDLTGDPKRDRAFYTWLARLQELSGDADGAVAFLDKAAKQFPDEPTFTASAARILLRAEQYQAALEHAETALGSAWGDNRLTTALLKVQALDGLDRRDEAVSFAKQVLAESPAPEGGVDVRTHRYRQRLEDFVSPEKEAG